MQARNANANANASSKGAGHRIIDPKTQCPDCGAQLIVNLRGFAEYTCGAIVKNGETERLCSQARTDLFRPVNSAPTEGWQHNDTCANCDTPARDHDQATGECPPPQCDEIAAEQRYLDSIAGPQAAWSNIGNRIWMAHLNGIDIYTTRSQGDWVTNVAKAGRKVTLDRYHTKREAMLAAERAAS